MKIVICGMGYVGVTMAACLLKQGHRVVGIDVNAAKIETIAAGRSPIHEPGVGELLLAGHREGRLVGDIDLQPHLADADMVLLCVGTPSAANGALDLSQVRQVTGEIGAAMASRTGDAGQLLIVYRSTMLPGSMDKVVMPALIEAIGEAPGTRYEVAYNPEFLRESTAVRDYFDPPKIVIGERAKGQSQRLMGLYDGIEAPTFEVPFASAEMLKYVDNSFHALKVAFANEVGRLALETGIDAQEVMEIFLADTKLNISPYYLRPGGAFGGSCLPKDVRALSACMRDNGVHAPIVDNLMATNNAHKEYVAKRVLNALPSTKRVLMLGLTFKSDTDDLRESHLVDLAERLLGAGCELKIFDPDLKTDELIGQNLRFVEEHLPHLSRLLVTEPLGTAEASDLVVLGKAMPAVMDSLPRGTRVINLHRL